MLEYVDLSSKFQIDVLFHTNIDVIQLGLGSCHETNSELEK